MAMTAYKIPIFTTMREIFFISEKYILRKLIVIAGNSMSSENYQKCLEVCFYPFNEDNL